MEGVTERERERRKDVEREGGKEGETKEGWNKSEEERRQNPN